MIHKCENCGEEFAWCWERSVYWSDVSVDWPDATQSEVEVGEIQCPECDECYIVDD